MAKRYMDWADWAGDHHVEAEAELREEARRKLERTVALMKAQAATMPQKTRDERLAELAQSLNECEHAEVSNSGYCTNCGEAVEGWEPDDAQLLTQHGTKEPAA